MKHLCTRSSLKPFFGILCIFASGSTLWAQSATFCPAFTPPQGPNLALNPGFETVGACGPFTYWSMGNGNCGLASAALDWNTHSSNQGALIVTQQFASTLPIGGQTKMVHIAARGNEAGVWQSLPAGLTQVMVSAWVNVRRGHVVLQATAGNTGPASWNIKTNEWELLRVCTDGTVPVDTIVIYNEDPSGGDFFVDRVEAYSLTP